MERKTVTELFRELAADWPEYAGQLVSFRLSPIVGREVSCQVGASEFFSFTITKDAMAVRDGRSSRPDADVVMSEADWRAVVDGSVGIMSIIVAGRCPYPKHQRYVLSKLSILLQSLATIRSQN